ncbi:MAG: hypothetical protein VB040_06925 [Propionibacterium sp.]|nr:hypothetical protein [Propionibacterium sp.]
MTTHFQTEALQLKELFKEHTRTISSDPDLTAEAKRRRIEDLRANFAPRLGKLRELHESAQAAEDTRLRRAAFGPASGTSPEAHRAAVSAARLAFTTGGKEALHAAAQDAELGADEVAARAVFAVAEQAGEAELVSAYLNTHPSHRPSTTQPVLLAGRMPRSRACSCPQRSALTASTTAPNGHSRNARPVVRRTSKPWAVLPLRQRSSGLQRRWSEG